MSMDLVRWHVYWILKSKILRKIILKGGPPFFFISWSLWSKIPRSKNLSNACFLYWRDWKKKTEVMMSASIKILKKKTPMAWLESGKHERQWRNTFKIKISQCWLVQPKFWVKHLKWALAVSWRQEAFLWLGKKSPYNKRFRRSGAEIIPGKLA